MGWHPVAAVLLQIYTQTVHKIQGTTYTAKQKKKWSEKCGPCPACASYTLAFALQLREKHEKTSLRVHPLLEVNTSLLTA
jgi:hypothetical protein